MPTERTNRLKGTLDLIPENSSADFGSSETRRRGRPLGAARTFIKFCEISRKSQNLWVGVHRPGNQLVTALAPR